MSAMLPEPKVEVLLVGGPAHGAIIRIGMATTRLSVLDTNGERCFYAEGKPRQVILRAART
jgi:hypothetical protein